jgi:hypothetical protein
MCRQRSSIWRHLALIRSARIGPMQVAFGGFACRDGVSAFCFRSIFLRYSIPLR